MVIEIDIHTVRRCMEEWAQCTLLTPMERSIVEEFRRAAAISMEEFIASKDVVCNNMAGLLISAIEKAKYQGIGV